jgi:hypothetical protein
MMRHDAMCWACALLRGDVLENGATQGLPWIVLYRTYPFQENETLRCKNVIPCQDVIVMSQEIVG